jgi:hypothetical protein
MGSKGSGVGAYAHSPAVAPAVLLPALVTWDIPTTHPASGSHWLPACLPPVQAQTAELRSSIYSIKQLVGTLEASSSSQKAAAAAAADGAAGGGDGGLTVSDLRQELRAFAQSLHE